MSTVNFLEVRLDAVHSRSLCTLTFLYRTRDTQKATQLVKQAIEEDNGQNWQEAFKVGHRIVIILQNADKSANLLSYTRTRSTTLVSPSSVRVLYFAG